MTGPSLLPPPDTSLLMSNVSEQVTGPAASEVGPRSSSVRTRIVVGILLLTGAGAAALSVREFLRYRTASEMTISLQEFSEVDYPEDPSGRSPHFGKYCGRQLQLIQRDATHFDFVVLPQDDHAATVTFRNVDVSLMTPSLPESCRGHEGNTRIALTDRQWNRQQVAFPADSPQIEISGGDGFEMQQLHSAELAKNCLNAGLWEVLLFSKGTDGKELYYQGWFTFPLGHYRRIFERNTGLDYSDHWYYLEHWFDPAGTVIDLAGLRSVEFEQAAEFSINPQESIVAAGEQLRKRRTVMARNLRQWQDFTGERREDITFASFIPPGRYSLDHPRQNEFDRLKTLESVSHRTINPTGGRPTRDELELKFRGLDGRTSKFLISGFQWDKLSQLPTADYPSGLYMPMGIGVPPFFQSYQQLTEVPPQTTPWLCVLLDEQDRWIDHHSVAIDGPVMHRDVTDPDLLHLYLLSYERHSLVMHVTIRRAPLTASAL